MFAVRIFPQVLNNWNIWFLVSPAIVKASQPCMNYITGYGF